MSGITLHTYIRTSNDASLSTDIFLVLMLSVISGVDDRNENVMCKCAVVKGLTVY